MEADEYVVVIGSAGLDIRARSSETLIAEVPNTGLVRQSTGGVARNIAENLARLEVPTVLLTAVGHDLAGQRVLRGSQQAGIDCQYVEEIRGERTGTYVAIQQPGGKLQMAISDFAIMEHINPAYFTRHEKLIAEARLIILDATLSTTALAAIFEMAQRHHVPVAADPTTPTLAGRLCPYLSQLYLVTPNAEETRALCGVVTAMDRETALQAARSLVTQGVDIAVVTLSDQGLAYADSGGGGYIKAVHTSVVDTTGAGDAFFGATVFGLLNDVPVDEAMRLGITAASLTLESSRTVLPYLSQELLYSKLAV